ncbi:MAG: hypothetical protein GY798_25105, partial [Hyphomicrobiales bacterium]|nr:hypothetical protein [Hyphomicrobiales bacterium]
QTDDACIGLAQLIDKATKHLTSDIRNAVILAVFDDLDQPGDIASALGYGDALLNPYLSSRRPASHIDTWLQHAARTDCRFHHIETGTLTTGIATHPTCPTAVHVDRKSQVARQQNSLKLFVSRPLDRGIMAKPGEGESTKTR